ncbi:transcription antitermination factor NusB [Paenalkalicoccus suaedae]|uniref:Transcription antitermination protein NusB n=1 Tax=Paenalkalicoccus suaedae TaxID=2592382 RepID=A0A859FC98_9BACI|nr:transcription antitermination factor NusB [Paenalkalicoccus suaedae]QKS70963.1 transcription antitermination factor NusB [Paenalkalicoccus suaedae]
MNRRIARIKTVQALYQIEMTGVEPEEAISSTLQDGEVADEFLHGLVDGTLENQDEIDGYLEAALEHWALNRLSRVDRAILRLCVYEMKYVDDVPINVSINEAIDLAKGFNPEPDAGKFVNGVVSKVAQQLS